MSPDNYTSRKALDDAGAEIAVAITNYREGDIDFDELLSVANYHIPDATVEQVIEAAQTTYQG